MTSEFSFEAELEAVGAKDMEEYWLIKRHRHYTNVGFSEADAKAQAEADLKTIREKYPWDETRRKELRGVDLWTFQHKDGMLTLRSKHNIQTSEKAREVRLAFADCSHSCQGLQHNEFMKCMQYCMSQK
jgi:hypothetical protein